MSQDDVTIDGFARLYERMRKLAGEKSHLQLVNHLMGRLSEVPGMENTAATMVRLILETIGGSNVALYYRIGSQISYVDAFGASRIVEAVEDAMVRQAFESKACVEEESSFADTGMTTAEFTTCKMHAQPLMVGNRLVGVLKLEGQLLSAADISSQFSLFFNYAALVLKNEIESHEALMIAYTQLEAISQLAAGIAHEINTPTQYISDNIHFVEESFQTVESVVARFKVLLQAVKAGTATSAMVAQLEAELERSDLDYISAEVPPAIAQAFMGIDHVTKIIRAMKEFSHPGNQGKVLADLNKAIDCTVTVACNEWDPVARMHLELDPHLPPVVCFLGDFNQAVLNLISNAAHAIGEVVDPASGSKGEITVTTRRDGEWVEVRIHDTGGGIPEANRTRILEPFFTTRKVGRGMGMGLSVAYGAIVKRHGGTLNFETVVGKGTTFIIRMPISDSNPGGRS